MPLPLLVPVGLGILGLFGLGKAAKAAADNKKAKEVAGNAENLVNYVENTLESGKKDCNSALRAYGELKLDVIGKEVWNFVDIFGRLKNVNLDHSPELDRLNVGEFTEITLENLKHTCSFAGEFVASAAAGASAGALTAFGAYGGTMMLASASTGTAISTLSGVAATNATLAWLGGGTLAAGGYGVAGGAVVLGVLVAGPALLILGGVLGAQASKRLSEARANMEKAKTFDIEAKVILDKLTAIVEVVGVGSEVLNALRGRLHNANVALEETVRIFGVDYSTFAEEAKDTVFKAVTYAQLVKKVIDTPILNEDGSLVEHAIIDFGGAKECLELEAVPA